VCEQNSVCVNKQKVCVCVEQNLVGDGSNPPARWESVQRREGVLELAYSEGAQMQHDDNMVNGSRERERDVTHDTTTHNEQTARRLRWVRIATSSCDSEGRRNQLRSRATVKVDIDGISCGLARQ
jgi:hypothetical protein